MRSVAPKIWPPMLPPCARASGSGVAVTFLRALPLRADLRGETAYGAPQLDVPVRLNVNENPYPPSELLVADIAAAVGSVAGSLNRYPDREAAALRADLAGYLKAFEHVEVDPSCVWAANGSNEVMHQLLQAFGGPGRSVLGFAPTYAMYPQYCRDTFTTYLTEQREADFRLDPQAAVDAVRRHRPVITLLTSPNNPTGTALPLATAEAVLTAAAEHDGLVVVDEAYAEFRREGTASALGLLSVYDNLIVTRTMSKAFAYAGARVGYLVADAAIVDAVRIVRLPYHLSSVTQTVASSPWRMPTNCWPRSPRCAPSATPGRLAAQPPVHGGRLRRQLRVLRAVRRPALDLAGAARPRCADPGDRPARMASGQHRHGCRDGELPAGFT